jgi:hypothetical protein
MGETGVDTTASTIGVRCDELEGVDVERSDSPQQASASACVIFVCALDADRWPFRECIGH